MKNNDFIVETEFSIYEFDDKCLKCKSDLNTFLLLTCLRYIFYS